jgi:hypothetical protein
MSIFRRFVVFVCFVCSLCTYVNAAHVKSNIAFKSFWHPTFLGERLDYCTLDSKECGKEVANRYCQMLGFEYSSQSIIAYNVGLTHYLGSRAACKGWRCNGFMTIDCAKSLTHTPPRAYHYIEKRFAYPRYNDYRVDWCYNQNNGCGRKAADSFCSRMGYMKVKSFIKETQISATKTIGSQELCFGPECNAFQSIVCTR